MEKTRHAGIEMKPPTANARTSDKLASVIEGPTSTSALLIRSSRDSTRACRFTAFTSIHMLSTPTWSSGRLTESNIICRTRSKIAINLQGLQVKIYTTYNEP